MRYIIAFGAMPFLFGFAPCVGPSEHFFTTLIIVFAIWVFPPVGTYRRMVMNQLLLQKDVKALLYAMGSGFFSAAIGALVGLSLRLGGLPHG